jgi:O-antigen ligase
VNHAHNDYLEFASDTGLLGVALLFLPILYLLAKMIISFLDDPRRYRRSITLGCIGSSLALLIHSMTDFNLQVPANALIFAVVLGIGYKATCVERQGNGRKVDYPTA